jgi:hypothetical protein
MGFDLFVCSFVLPYYHPWTVEVEVEDADLNTKRFLYWRILVLFFRVGLDWIHVTLTRPRLLFRLHIIKLLVNTYSIIIPSTI